MTKTMKEQNAEAKRLMELIENGSALANKLAGELKNVRVALETLRAFQPNDQFKIAVPYSMRRNDRQDEMNMREIIDVQLANINAILGDRA